MDQNNLVADSHQDQSTERKNKLHNVVWGILTGVIKRGLEGGVFIVRPPT